MNEILLQDICNCDFNIYNIFAKRQRWKDRESYSYMNSPRQFNCFMYLKNCSCTLLCSDGKSIFAKNGEMLYIPKNAKYKIDFWGKNGAICNTYLVNFLMDDSGGEEATFGSEIVLMPGEIADDVRQYIDEIVMGYGMIDNCSAKMKALMYGLCYNLGRKFANRFLHTQSVEYRIIADGIEYIENNIANDVCIDHAAQMCSVSSGCFRRLFKNYAGCSPKEYVVKKRLRKAKELLQSGIYDVGEVADVLGFVNSAYFSRFFKQKVGCSPSEYMAKENAKKL